MIFRVISIVLLAALSVQAEDEQEALISRIAHDVVAGVMPIEISVSPSQAPNQRVLDIAKKLAEERPVSEEAVQARLAMQQTLVMQRSSERDNLMDQIKANVLQGVVICLFLIVAQFLVRQFFLQGAQYVFQKAGESRLFASHSRLRNRLLFMAHFAMEKNKELQQGKNDRRLVTVNMYLKTAPYLLAISMDSVDAAALLGRVLVQDRLIARADIVPQRFLIGAGNTEGVLMLVQTVKGRLKKIKRRLKGEGIAGLVVLVPIIKGFGPHINWIADMADGRG